MQEFIIIMKAYIFIKLLLICNCNGWGIESFSCLCEIALLGLYHYTVGALINSTCTAVKIQVLMTKITYVPFIV